MLSGEATNTNFIIFCLTRPGLDPTIFHTQGEQTNHYMMDVVQHDILLIWHYTTLNHSITHSLTHSIFFLGGTYLKIYLLYYMINLKYSQTTGVSIECCQQLMTTTAPFCLSSGPSYLKFLFKWLCNSKEFNCCDRSMVFSEFSGFLHQ
jgi:hypothetical protein